MIKKTQIILITGKAQSGKDTSADFLINQFNTYAMAEKFTFAYALKEFCINVFGVERHKVWGNNNQKDEYIHIRWIDLPFESLFNLPVLMVEMGVATTADIAAAMIKNHVQMTGRQLLQVFGTQICRRIYNDCWAYSTLKRIYDKNPNYAIISDTRFPNELESFNLHRPDRQQFGDRIETSPIVVRLTRNVLNGTHQSETALDDYDFQTAWGSNYILVENKNMNQTEKENFLLDQFIQRNFFDAVYRRKLC